MAGGLLTVEAPFTLEPIEVVQRLDRLAGGIGRLGNQLAECRAELEPVEKLHDDHVENFVAGLWDQYVQGEVKKWPGEDVRLALAHREMDTAARGKYATLKQRERRITDAIERTSDEIRAFQSILSAQKAGLV